MYSCVCVCVFNHSHRHQEKTHDTGVIPLWTAHPQLPLVTLICWCPSPEFLLVLSVRSILSFSIPRLSLPIFIFLVPVFSLPPVLPSTSSPIFSRIAIAFLTSTLATRGRRTRPLAVSTLGSLAFSVVVAFTVAVVGSLTVW